MAFSRVAPGAALLSDVLAAMLLGMVWLGICSVRLGARAVARHGAKLRQTVPPISNAHPIVPSLRKSPEQASKPRQRRFPIFICLLGVGGLSLLAYLLYRRGVGDVWAALHAVGWGMATVVAFHVVPLFLDALAWWVLFPPRDLLPVLRLFWMRWMGEAVSTLLPAAQVGGDIVRARLAILARRPAAASAATVVGDLTLSIFMQIIFTVTGLALLVHVTHGTIGAGAVIGGAILGTVMVGAFYVASAGNFPPPGNSGFQNGQRHRLENACSQCRSPGCGTGRDVCPPDAPLAASAAWTLSSWFVGAGEVWIALHFLEIHRGFMDALILESVGQGIRRRSSWCPARWACRRAATSSLARCWEFPAISPSRWRSSAGFANWPSACRA